MSDDTGSIFEPIEMEWKGRIYRVPSNRVMGAIARIEEHITLPEISASSNRGGAPLAKIAAAYASVLRYAGAEVTDEEMYLGLFPNTGARTANAAQEAVTALLLMMVPPSARTGGTDSTRPPRRARRAAVSSSRKPTRQRDSGASDPTSSGR